jgi:hypothetical protein
MGTREVQGEVRVPSRQGGLIGKVELAGVELGTVLAESGCRVAVVEISGRGKQVWVRGTDSWRERGIRRHGVREWLRRPRDASGTGERAERDVGALNHRGVNEGIGQRSARGRHPEETRRSVELWETQKTNAAHQALKPLALKETNVVRLRPFEPEVARGDRLCNLGRVVNRTGKGVFGLVVRFH